MKLKPKKDKSQAETNAEGRKVLIGLKKRDKPAKNRVKGWGPVSAILVSVGIYFLSQIIVGLCLGIYASIKGMSAAEISEQLKNSVLTQFITILATAALSILLLRAFLKYRSISWSDIGVKKPKLNKLLLFIPAFAGYFIVLSAATFAIQALDGGINLDQRQEIGFSTYLSGGSLILVFLSLVMLPAIVEEIIVRGFLFGGLVKKMLPIQAAILTSIIFGFAHLQLGYGNSPVWIAAIDTFVLSMFLCWLRWNTGNVWAGVLLHMTKNSLAFIGLFILHL